MLFNFTKETKGIFSIISALLINIVCGSLYSWSGINGYFISYLRQYNLNSIKIEDGYFFMPIITITSMYFSPIVALINEKIGIKFISLISTIILIITNFILYNSTNLYQIYGCMLLYGIVNSLNYLPVIKNCLLFFQNKKGLINGMILFGYGTSSFIYNSIADYIINPNYKGINPNTGFFDKQITDNFIKYLKFFNIFNGIIALISFFILFEYKEKENNKKNEKEIVKSEKDDEEVNISLKDALIQAAKGCQLYQLWIMSTVLQLVSFSVSNIYRSFAQQNSIDEYLLSNLTKIYFILNGLSRLIWGFLIDKFTFKHLYSICILSQLLIVSFFYYSVKYPYAFFFLICFHGLIIGKISLNITMFTKIYGIKYFGFIYSVTSAVGGFSHLLGPLLIKLAIKSLEDYKKIYFGGSIACIISFIILINFSEKKFKYEKPKEETELIETLN